ncbi:thioredoxin domain-containing protein, partial [Streptomyces sp. WAC01526]
AFQKAVKDGTYDRWALEVSNAFNSVKDVKSTPTIKLNGTVLGKDTPQGKVAPDSVADYNSLVEKELKK